MQQPRRKRKAPNAGLNNARRMAEYQERRNARDARRRELSEAVSAQRPAQVLPDLSVKVVRGPDQPLPPKVKVAETLSDYQRYISSPQWLARKRRYFKTHPRRCRICRAGVRFDDQIHLHHLSYEHMGDEPDSDLMPLCQEHHAAIHKFHQRQGGSLRAATLACVTYLESRVLPSAAAGGRSQPR